jgi:hypothetical protein
LRKGSTVASFEVTADSLVLHIDGLDRVRAFKNRVEVPLDHVVSVAFDPDDTRREMDAFWKETFMPGAIAPSHSLVGAFTEHGDRIFWDVHHSARAVTINLAHDRYKKIIAEVDDPRVTAESLQQAVRRESKASAR